MKWGVYANRDFAKGEIVNIASLTLPIPADSKIVEQTVLNDYVYGYWRLVYPDSSRQEKEQQGRPAVLPMYSVLLGPDMFYNHHSMSNVAFQTFGREPDFSAPNAVNPQGFVAQRGIRRGEELFSNYKSGNEDDGGIGWFSLRGVPLEAPPMNETTLSREQITHYSQVYCSKIVAGVGLPSWRDRLVPLLPPPDRLPFWIQDQTWLAPFDAGWGSAKAKVAIHTGERIEISAALVMSLRQVKGTALRPLVYTWDELYPEQQHTLKQLRDKRQLMVQYQGPDTSWKSVDGFTSFDDLVLFPAAGNIGMVRRRLHRPTNYDDENKKDHPMEESNCRLVFHGDSNQLFPHSQHHYSVSVTIELIATKDIDVGQTLVLDLRPTSTITQEEYQQLDKELRHTGQPYERGLILDRQQQESQTLTTKPSASETHKDEF
jgi:hypothetical protein